MGLGQEEGLAICLKHRGNGTIGLKPTGEDQSSQRRQRGQAVTCRLHQAPLPALQLLELACFHCLCLSQLQDAALPAPVHAACSVWPRL